MQDLEQVSQLHVLFFHPSTRPASGASRKGRADFRVSSFPSGGAAVKPLFQSRECGGRSCNHES